MAANPTQIEGLLQEDRRIPPPKEFAEQANVRDPDVYLEAARDPAGFWAGFAQELHWFKKWDQVLDWAPPFAQWFVGGKLNVSYNCLDRHLDMGRGDKAALVWEGEPGDSKTYTYAELHREVCRFANALKSLGVGKGDTVAIYLPKTRSGKIMRRLLRTIAKGEQITQDTSTLENEAILDQLRGDA